MSLLECLNTETCPDCGKLPDRTTRVWRFVGVECACGKSFGMSGMLPMSGPGSSIPVLKAAFKNWNDKAREAKGLPKKRSRFRVGCAVGGQASITPPPTEVGGLIGS